jgi:hypothetical protein
MAELKTVVVDRKTWLRGESSKDSYLYRKSDGKMCCIGFVCLACGMDKKQIADCDTLRMLVAPYHDGKPVDMSVLPQKMWLVDESGEMQGLYLANDKQSKADGSELYDEDREADIIARGVRVGIKFEFVN